MQDEILDILLHCREDLGMTSATLVWTEQCEEYSPRIMLFYEQYKIMIQLRLENILVNLEDFGYEQTVESLDQQIEIILLRYKRMMGD